MSAPAKTTSLPESHLQAEADGRAVFGFWVYLMTDCILFASLFATFAVLRNNTYGGLPGSQLFSLPYILTETIALLLSSFTCGVAILAAQARRRTQVIGWFIVTFLLGATFLGLELHEFAHLAGDGNSWRRSGFLSGYFTLVGTHGLHITIGLIWMAVMIIRITRRGLTPSSVRKLTLLSLFWHFLDIIWIFIFSMVYLLGAA